MLQAGNDQNKQKEGYRGALIYSQEDGYKMISMHVQLYPGEQSSVTSHSYEVFQEEEAEHLNMSAPLAGVDLYTFPAADNATNIKLTIEGQGQRHSAIYSVGEDGITELSPSLRLDIIEQGKILDLEAKNVQEWETALGEALEYYKDEIPGWLNLADRFNETIHEQPFHHQEEDIDIDR